jgi:adenosylcobinamide-phosphate synthase
LSLSMAALLLVGGVALDLLLGEVRRWHPLVGFGMLAGGIERAFNRRRYMQGILGWMLAVLPVVALAAAVIALLDRLSGPWLAGFAHAVLLYVCLGLRSLREHALPIERALLRGELADARALTARIVSRDTAQADEADLAKAAAESTLENGNDAVFGTLFWFLLAGGPGAVLFRLANTLDAMWGYRTPRFERFGCRRA